MSKQKNKYIPVYTKEDYKRDSDIVDNAINQNKPIDYTAFQRLMIYDLCAKTELLNNGSIDDISMNDIQTALSYPRNSCNVLLRLSEKLMHISPHYYRLNMMYSNMALFCWWLDIYDVKEDKIRRDILKRNYERLAAKLEDMNLKHEFGKIMKTLPYQDIFCGLILDNGTDFFIQQVNYHVCKLYQVQDGLYNFAINLNSIKGQDILAFPEYVQQAYFDYRDNIITDYWYIPPADKQICIKMNSQWCYPFPLLIGLVKDVLDLDIYKKLKLQSARTDNYKAIMMKVPIDTNTVDKPLLTPEVLGIFAEINRASLNDDIGIIYTLGSDGETISFKDSNNTRNNVSDAVENLYDDSGITQELFNGSSSGTAVTLSVENDAGFIYGVYRQFERWVNRYIKLQKYNTASYKFKFTLLDITIFNRDNISKRYKDAVTLGATVIDKWLATLDMTPSRVLGSYFVHTDIFDFQNKFKPLVSSYNTSTEGQAGRPSNKSQNKISDVAGEQTADSDANLDR